MTSIAKTISGKYEFSVYQFSDSEFRLYRRPLNPRTGEPWQKRQNIQRFIGENAKAKAMFAWCKMAKAA